MLDVIGFSKLTDNAGLLGAALKTVTQCGRGHHESLQARNQIMSELGQGDVRDRTKVHVGTQSPPKQPAIKPDLACQVAG